MLKALVIKKTTSQVFHTTLKSNLHNLKSNLIAVVFCCPALNSGILTSTDLDLRNLSVFGSLKLALTKWVPGISNFQYSPDFVVLTGCFIS